MLASELKILKRDMEGRINLDEVVQTIPIQKELKGNRKKFWLCFSDGKVLFKETNQDSYEDYAELLSEGLCEAVGLPTAHYDLAFYNGKKGVISYDFRQPGENFIAGSILLKKYINTMEENNGLVASNTIDNKLYNNLNTIEKALNLECSERLVSCIMEKMDLLYALDCIGLQADRHWNNWGILNFICQGHLIKKFAPQFDGGNLCRFGISKKKIKSKLNYLNMQSNLTHIQKILEHDLIPASFDVSYGLRYDEQLDKEFFGVNRLMKAYIDNPIRFQKVIEILLQIDSIDIVDSIEKRIHARVPDDCTYWFIHIINYNLEILQKMKEEIDNTKGNSQNSMNGRLKK